MIPSGAPSGPTDWESSGAGAHSQVGFISRMASLAWNKNNSNMSQTSVQGGQGLTLKCSVKHTVAVASHIYTVIVSAHLLRNDCLVVFQDQPLDVMSPQLPLLHCLGLQVVEEKSMEVMR